MKIKKYLLGSLIILSGISLTNATYNGGGINVPIGEYVQVSEICNDIDNANVGHYITFDNNLNIKYIENGVEYNGFKFHSCGWQGIWGYLYWNNNKLTYGGDFWTNGGVTNNIPNNVGYINNVCRTTKGNICTTSNLSMSEFISIRENWESFTIIPEPTNANAPTYGYLVICFNATDITYCINYNLATSGSSLGFTQYNPTDIGQAHYDLPITDWSPYFSSSPIRGYGGATGTPETQNYSCVTIQQLINTYGDEYNESQCYSSNMIYSGGTIQTVTPKSIFELYPTLTGFTQDISTFNSYCNNASSTQACQTMFENKTEQYTLIAKIPNTVQPLKLYQYCNLKLNYDPTQTTCTANTGVNQQIGSGIDINDIIKEIGEGDYTVTTPGTPPQSNGTGNGSGSVFDNLIGNQEDNTERRNVVKNAKNIIQTMKELYVKMTGIFRGREGKQGIIPAYITGIILLIVLFKLFKK